MSEMQVGGVGGVVVGFKLKPDGVTHLTVACASAAIAQVPSRLVGHGVTMEFMATDCLPRSPDRVLLAMIAAFREASEKFAERRSKAVTDSDMLSSGIRRDCYAEMAAAAEQLLEQSAGA